jgi:hypothetical protein
VCASSTFIDIVTSAARFVELVAGGAGESVEAGVGSDVVATFLVRSTYLRSLNTLVDVDAVSRRVWFHAPRTVDDVALAVLIVEFVADGTDF